MHLHVALSLLQPLDRLLQLPDVLSQSVGGFIDPTLEPPHSINEGSVGDRSRTDGALTSSSASGSATTRSRPGRLLRSATGTGDRLRWAAMPGVSTKPQEHFGEILHGVHEHGPGHLPQEGSVSEEL